MEKTDKTAKKRFLLSLLRHFLKGAVALAALLAIWAVQSPFPAALFSSFEELFIIQIPDFATYLFATVLLLVYVWVMWGYLDRNDEEDLADTLASPPRHLLLRPPYLVSYAFALGQGIFLSSFVGRAIPALPAALSPLLAIFLVLGLRFLQLHLHLYWQLAEGRAGDARIVPSLSRRLINGGLVLFSLAVAYPAAHFLIVLATSLFRDFAVEMLYGVFFLVLVILAVALGFVLAKLSRRKRFLSRVRRMERDGRITVDLEGHPYLSALSHRFLFNLTVKTGSGKTYLCAFISGKDRFTPLVLQRRSAVFVCGLHVRTKFITRGGYVGDSLSRAGKKQDAAFFEYFSVWDLGFPEGEGEKVVIIDKPPASVSVEDGDSRVRFLDNGDRVFDYQVFTKSAFCNHLDRTE